MPLPYTYQRTITTGSASGSVETGIVLQNSYMTRACGQLLDPTWGRTRIGIRYRLNVSGSQFASGSGVNPFDYNPWPVFFYGLCNGTATAPGAADKINCFIGASWWDVQPVWVPNGYVDVYYSSNGGVNGLSGSLMAECDIFDNLQFLNLAHTYISTATSSCDMQYIEISRSLANPLRYWLKIWRRVSNAQSIGDYYTRNQFLVDMQVATPVKSGYSVETLESSGDMSASLTYPLDSIFILYDNEHPIEILDVSVSTWRVS